MRFSRLILIGVLACSANLSADSIAESQLIIDFKRLASAEFSGRRPETLGHQLAQSYITERYAAIGLSWFGDSYQQPFKHQKLFTEVQGTNLVGMYYGGERANQFVVITAHYDHLGLRQGKRYLGADDNASGVAGLLHLAQTISQQPTRFSYIFLATDQEEAGLYGSNAFVKRPPVPLDAIVLNVNLDMISRGDKCGCLYLAGSKSSPVFKSVLKQVTSSHNHNGFTLKRGHDKKHFRTVSKYRDDVDWYRASDHYAFAKKRIPYLYFGVDTHTDYHQPTDTFENVDIGFYLSANRAIVDYVLTLDSKL